MKKLFVIVVFLAMVAGLGCSTKKVYYVNFAPGCSRDATRARLLTIVRQSDMHLVPYAPQIGFKPLRGEAQKKWKQRPSD